MKKYSKMLMAKRIKEARISRFNGTVTQKEAADYLGVPYPTYQKWEHSFSFHKQIISLTAHHKMVYRFT